MDSPITNTSKTTPMPVQPSVNRMISEDLPDRRSPAGREVLDFVERTRSLVIGHG